MSFYEDMQAKDAARASRSSRPGVVSVSAEEARRLDRRLEEKISVTEMDFAPMELMSFEADLMGGKGPIRLAVAPAVFESKPKARPTDVTVEDLKSIQADLYAKQQGKLVKPAAQPGAVSQGAYEPAISTLSDAGHHHFESLGNDAIAKQQVRGALPSASPGVYADGEQTLQLRESDVASKAQACNPDGPATFPGAVAFAGTSLSQMEADMVAKQVGRKSAPTLTPGAVASVSSLSQMEQDIAAKQQVDRLVAVAPGAVSMEGSQLAQMEQDIAAKQRDGNRRAPGPEVVTAGGSQLAQMEQDVAAKRQNVHEVAVTPGAVAAGGSQLAQMEEDVATKQLNGHVRASGPGVVAAGGSQLAQMEQDVAAKRQSVREVAGSAGESQLAQMEQDIFFKQQGRIGPDAPPGLQQASWSELAAMESAVNSKNYMRGMSSGRSELSSMEDALSYKAGTGAASSGTYGNSSPSGSYSEMIGMSDLAVMETDLLLKNETSESAKPQEGPKAMEPEQYPKVQQPVGIGIAPGGLAPDVEYGFHDPSGEGLVVAMPVTDDPYIEPAVEYEPDSKPTIYRQRRFRLYAFLAFFALVATAVGTVIGVVLSGNNKNESNSSGQTVSYRETLGIKDRVEGLVGINELNKPDSPYAKALVWITHNDTLQVVPESPNFMQRYICAYFYFATTESGEWKSCNPPKENAPDFCSFSKLVSVDPLAYVDISWTRWLTGRHECAWAGITCDEALQLRTIELSGQELSGPFPDGVKYLPFLQSIVLNWGSLYGTLPASLMEMKHLVNVEIHENKFSGSVPEEWWEARSLGRLNLAGNDLTGTISTLIGNMRDLGGLYLYDNQFRGTIPTQIGELTGLSFFKVNDNALEGPIPTEMVKMNSLEHFWVHRNMLTGSLPDEIGQMAELLYEIRVSKNEKLGGTLPDSLYELSTLFRLDLAHCNFSGTLSPKIAAIPYLESLELTNNPISGPLPTEVGALQSLRSLELSGTDLTGNIPEPTCDLRRSDGFLLTTLEANCKETGDVGPELKCSCCTLCCDEDGEECVVP